MDADEESSTSDLSSLLVGDLLWHRVAGFPYWPCMVSYDPLQGIFTKFKTGSKQFGIIYHVQYFGDAAHHGWTTPNNMLIFKGRNQFENYLETMREAAKSLPAGVRHKVLNKYTISPFRLDRWEKAVEEAESALAMPRRQRVEEFVFIYHLPSSSQNVKFPSSPALTPSSTSQGNILPKVKTENGNSNEVKLKTKFKQKAVNGAIKGIKDSSLSEVIDVCEERKVARSDLLCQLCEKCNIDITCSGKCSQSFHMSCLGMIQASDKFLCDECLSDNHSCFSCKKTGNVKKCALSFCSKFYHPDCMQKYPRQVDKFVCPLHYCLSCYNDNPRNPCGYKSRLIKCFRCPTAYHSRENCIAAGSESLSQSFILCPEHFVPSKGRPYQSVVNTSWCLICGKGGQIILCESCPAAFHETCLDIEHPDGKYYCDECVSRKQIRCGNILWVKIGIFRWWPSRVLFPDEVPLNIQKMKHEVGEFPIMFFGTHDYYWIHKGRAFPYSEEDKVDENCTIKLGSDKRYTSLKDKYKLGLVEAAEAFVKWEQEKLSEFQSNQKLPIYKHIKTNRPIGKVQIYPCDMQGCVQCSCDPNMSNPCGYDSTCLNRSMLVECHPDVCKAQNCQNQMFQKRSYVECIPFKTIDRGWALKTVQDVKKGEFVNEYVGDLIDEEECKKRLQQKHLDDDNNYYFLTLDKDRIIDAGPKGNYSRFMNHCCEPNCETQKWIVNGDVRIGLFAKKDIPSGTELTFDYKLDSLNNAKLKCLCGAANCSGALGENASNTAKSEAKKKEKKVKKRKRNLGAKVESEYFCYICKKQGTLVLCDRKGCTKSYHVACLKRKCVPSGRWECPWHYCDICGRFSKYLCSKCPNSYCHQHKPSTIVSPPSKLLLCPDHDSDASDNCCNTDHVANGEQVIVSTNCNSELHSEDSIVRAKRNKLDSDPSINHINGNAKNRLNENNLNKISVTNANGDAENSMDNNCSTESVTNGFSQYHEVQ